MIQHLITFGAESIRVTVPVSKLVPNMVGLGWPSNMFNQFCDVVV